MAALFPKYHELVCDTYTPDFVGGAAPCVLQSGDAFRSRLVAGGSFFRSVETGSTATINNIVLQLTVEVDTVIVDVTTYICTFTYTDANGVAQTPIIFSQAYNNGETPGCSGTTGPNALRALLAGNSIVTMPTTDVQQPWAAGTDDSDCLMVAFGPTNMAGGGGLPSDVSPVRTGPAYTLYHVDESEANEADGTMVVVNELSEWDGTKWIPHPSTLYAPGTCPD